MSIEASRIRVIAIGGGARGARTLHRHFVPGHKRERKAVWLCAFHICLCICFGHVDVFCMLLYMFLHTCCVCSCVRICLLLLIRLVLYMFFVFLTRRVVCSAFVHEIRRDIFGGAGDWLHVSRAIFGTYWRSFWDVLEVYTVTMQSHKRPIQKAMRYYRRVFKRALWRLFIE